MSDPVELDEASDSDTTTFISLLRRLISSRDRSENSTRENPKLYKYCESVSKPFHTNTELISNTALEFDLNRLTQKGSYYSIIKNRQIQPGLKSSLDYQQRMVYSSRCIPNAVSIDTGGSLECRIFVSRFTVDGKIFYLASQDGRIMLYDTTGACFKLKREILACDIHWAVLSCAVNIQNTYMIYTTWSPYVYFYKLEDSSSTPTKLLISQAVDSFAGFSSCFSTDGKFIIVAGSDGYFYMYDLVHCQLVNKIACHEDHANACTFLDEACNLVLSGGEDGLARLWDRRLIGYDKGTPVATFAGHIDSITSLDGRRDSIYFVSNSKDQKAKLWDVRIPSEQTAINITKCVVSYQHWDYRWQAAPSSLGGLKHKEDCSVATYSGHTVRSTLISAKFSPAYSTGQRYIYTGSHDGKIYIYDILTGETKAKLFNHNAPIRDCSWHPYETWLCSSSWDGTWCKWVYQASKIGMSETSFV